MSVSQTRAEKHRRIFRRRMLVHTSIAAGLLVASLGFGMLGYEHYEHLDWLFSGLVVIAVTGLLLGPGVHHLMHIVHWEEEA